MSFRPYPKQGKTPKKQRKPLKKSQWKQTPNQKTRKLLISFLDTLFSKYIRISHADERGYARCFTCPPEAPAKHWTKLQNGHYITRGNMATRYFIPNCKPQCEECNCFNHGRIEVFRERLSDHELQLITEQARKVVKYTNDDLQETINIMRTYINSKTQWEKKQESNGPTELSIFGGAVKK